MLKLSGIFNTMVVFYMIRRNILNILKKNKKSLLILGPRQCGKSTLMRQLKPDLEVNLFHEQTFFEFSRNPSELESRLKACKGKLIFIDEIQRLPSLLNTIQVILDKPSNRYRFLLTGSSARKLRRGHANLLPGRINTYELGAVVASELGFAIDEERCLKYGSLPGIYSAESDAERQKTLRSYAATYLKEEIQAEALTRNIENFSRFLHVAALASGEYLDLTKLGSEAGISPQSAKRYFEILEDTLIVHSAKAFAKSSRKRLVKHPKYYFFDTGVLNAIMENFICSPDRKGRLFENLIFNQLTHSAVSRDIPIKISSYRTSHGAEVDLIVELNSQTWAIEVKCSKNIGPHDLRGMKSFEKYYGKPFEKIIAYTGEIKKVIEDVTVYPWQDLLKEMGL